MKMRSIFLAMLFGSSFLQTNQLQAGFGDFLYGTCTFIKKNQGMIKIAAAIIIPFTGTVYVGYVRRCLKAAEWEAQKNGKTLTGLVTQVDLLKKTANDTKTQSETNGKTLTELGTQVDLLKKTATDTKTQSVENGQTLTKLGGQVEAARNDFAQKLQASGAQLLQRFKEGQKLTKEELSKLQNLLIANNDDIKKLFVLVAGVNHTLEKQVTQEVGVIQTSQKLHGQTLVKLQSGQQETNTKVDRMQNTLGEINQLLQKIAGNQQQTNKGIQSLQTGVGIGVLTAFTAGIGIPLGGIGQFPIQQSCSQQLLTQT